MISKVTAGTDHSFHSRELSIGDKFRSQGWGSRLPMEPVCPRNKSTEPLEYEMPLSIMNSNEKPYVKNLG